MASIFYRAGAGALRRGSNYRIRPRPTAQPQTSQHHEHNPPRFFSTTLRSRAKEEEGGDKPKPASSKKSTTTPTTTTTNSIVDLLTDNERAKYDAMSKADQAKYERQIEAFLTHMQKPSIEARIGGKITTLSNQFEKETWEPPVPLTLNERESYLNLSETEPEFMGNEPDFIGDDMTSMGHGELEQHRELREYYRIAAWEMPLLTKLAKPFQPPSKKTPLRFRYTDYMGEEHPAAHKVVLEFCTADLPLEPAQRLKLVKLVGPRYDPQTDIVKMSSEMFESQAQNKRYLGDLVDTLMSEARAEGAENDKFDDVPVDFRHVNWKKKFAFPDKWKVTEERKLQLEQGRRALAAKETERIERNLLVDGDKLVREMAARQPVASKAQVLLEAQRGKKGGRGEKARLR